MDEIAGRVFCNIKKWSGRLAFVGGKEEYQRDITSGTKTNNERTKPKAKKRKQVGTRIPKITHLRV